MSFILAAWGVFKTSKVARWALFILLGILLVGLIVWRIFAAGKSAGAASYKAKIDEAVEILKGKMRDAVKLKGEDDATNRMDKGGF